MSRVDIEIISSIFCRDPYIYICHVRVLECCSHVCFCVSFRMVEALVFYGSFVSFTLWKIKMEPENDGLEDDCLFKWVIFRFRLLIFQGTR